MADQFRDRELDPRRAWNEGVLPRMKEPPRALRSGVGGRKVKPFVAPSPLPSNALASGDSTERAAISDADQAIADLVDPTAGEAIRGACRQARGGSLIDKAADAMSATRDPSFGEPDATFTVPAEALDGLTLDEQRWLEGSSNAAQFQHRQQAIQDRRDEMKALFHKGTATGLAATVLMSAPESLIGGGMIAAARATRATLAGKKAVEARSAIGVIRDAALSNAAETAFQASFDPFTGTQDVLMAGALGGIMGLPGGIARVRRLDGKEGSMEALDADLAPNPQALAPEVPKPAPQTAAEAASDTVKQWDAEDAAKAASDQPAAAPVKPEATAQPEQPAKKPDIGDDPAAWHEAPRPAFPKADAAPAKPAIEAEDIEPVVKAKSPEAAAQEAAAPVAKAADPVPPAAPDAPAAQVEQAADAPARAPEEPQPGRVEESTDATGRTVRTEDIEVTAKPKPEAAPVVTTNDIGDTVEHAQPAPNDVDVAPQPVAEVKPGDRSKDAMKKAAGLDDIDYVAGAQSGYSLRQWAKTIGIEDDVVVTRSVYHTGNVPKDAISIAREIVDEFIPGHQVALIGRRPGDTVAARSTFLHPKKTGIEVDFDDPHWRFNLVHELGHRVFGNAIANKHIPSSLRSEYLQFHENLTKALGAKSTDDIAKDAIAARFDKTDPRLRLASNVLSEDAAVNLTTLDVLSAVVDGMRGDDAKKYLSSLHEIGADQFVKFYNRSGRIESGWPKMTKKVGEFLSDIYNRMIRYWKKIAGHAGDATEANPRHLFRAMQEKAAQRRAAFLDDREEVTPTKDLGLPRLGKLVDRGVKSRKVEAVLEEAPAAPPELRTADIRVAKEARTTPEEYGVDRHATSDDQRNAHAAAKHFHAKANAEDIPRVELGEWQAKLKGNPETVANSLISASAIMANSKNSIVRWFNSWAAESPSGTAGPRRPTAAIRKERMMHEIAGTDLHNLDAAKDAWLKEQGVTLWRRTLSVKAQMDFNRALSEALAGARKGVDPASPAMKAAVSAMHEIGKRIEAIETGTLGRKAGSGARGHFEQRIDGAALANLSTAQTRALEGLIAKQLAGQNGVNATQARAIAASHIRRALDNRLVQTGSAARLDAIDSEALASVLGIGKRPEFSFEVDPQADLGGGKTVMDVLNHDHYGIQRNRASSTAGWAALSEQGIKDQASANLLREAILIGKGAEKAEAIEVRAFDQVVAELTGGRFGTAGDSKALAAVTTATSVIRLGGLIFNTTGEILNLAGHIGFARTLPFLTSFRRMRKELLAIRDGKRIRNGLLDSMEKMYGSSFGAEGYLLVSPWDRPGLRADAGDSTLSQGALMRALNGAGHFQHVATGVRAMQMAQIRFTAQEMTRLALERAQHATNNPKHQRVLSDIGLSPEWLERNKAALHGATTWKGGQAVGFDIERLPADVADEFNTAIWRGAKQIIQGTFAGESGAWVHSDLARAMLQMKTFAINSIEKQQIRFWHNHGALNFAMTFLGTASAALPIHLARVAWNSAGKSEEERQEYLDRALSPDALFSATMTYMALSGVLPDAMQAITTLVGIDSYNQALIGGSFLPSADLLNDIYNAPSSPSRATRVVPLLNAAPVIPFMNMVRAPLKEQEKERRRQEREEKG